MKLFPFSLRAVFRGRAAGGFIKFARKMAGICKGVSHRDARDRLVGFGERSRSGEHAPLHPVFLQPAMQIALEQSAVSTQ